MVSKLAKLNAVYCMIILDFPRLPLFLLSSQTGGTLHTGQGFFSKYSNNNYDKKVGGCVLVFFSSLHEIVWMI